jgi:hypothetical protein
MVPRVRDQPICSADTAFPGAEYTDEERDFLRACDRYRHALRRRFLRAIDYLAVAKQLGYRQRTAERNGY